MAIVFGERVGRTKCLLLASSLEIIAVSDIQITLSNYDCVTRMAALFTAELEIASRL